MTLDPIVQHHLTSWQSVLPKNAAPLILRKFKILEIALLSFNVVKIKENLGGAAVWIEVHVAELLKSSGSRLGNGRSSSSKDCC